MMHRRLSLVLAVVFILAGCSSPFLGKETSAAPYSPAVPLISPTLTSQMKAPATPATDPSESNRLLIWVPPFLNPASEDPAGNLLHARLAEFQGRYANVKIEVRVKAESGPGGLLDSLATASAAAPGTLPDLVALPRYLEEAAALKGLLLTLDDLTTSLDDPDWFPYALELAHLQDDVFGFPIAGDALIQIYHTDLITTPITSWADVIQSGQTLLFPAASEESFFTLAEYQAIGGPPRDDQGRPILKVDELGRVLEFYQQAVQAGAFPVDLLTQLQDDQAAWEAFNANQGQIVITWSSQYLRNPDNQEAITQIPSPRGETFALTTGWVWSLVGRDEEKRRLAVSLAEFLTDSQFLADWSQSAGYLPPRPSSLNLWSNKQLSASIEKIASAAILFPPTDVLSALEIPLQQATLAVIRGQSAPVSAAEKASASLTSP